ncbi:MAG TPA: hypothetical protein VI653_19930, partial [Steroidobacteraceae bacterium]
SASTGACLSGSNRFALPSIGRRMLRSVAMRNTAPFSSAQSRAARNPGLSRLQLTKVCSVLYFDEFRVTGPVSHEEIRRVSTGHCTIAEGQSDWLGGERSVRVKETCEGDEVPFQGTLVLCGPCGKRLKADDV